MAESADLVAAPAPAKQAEPLHSGPVARHAALEDRAEVRAERGHGRILNGRPALVAQRKAAISLAGRRPSGPRPVQRSAPDRIGPPGDRSVIQAKGGKGKTQSAKQEARKTKLLERQVNKYQRQIEQQQRKNAEDKEFWDPWKVEIQNLKTNVLYSAEVGRYMTKTAKDSEEVIEQKRVLKLHWDHQVGLLMDNLNLLYGDNSASAREKLRSGMEAPWPRNKAGYSKMPSKIWNLVQEVFDARTVYHNQGVKLYPGGEGHPNLGKKKPDYYTANRDEGGKVPAEAEAGDAINLTAPSTDEAVRQAVADVASKVRTYPQVKVTVLIGAHSNPELLEKDRLAEVRAGIKDEELEPGKVIIISGSSSAVAFP